MAAREGSWIVVADEVQRALREGRGVVALETTLLVHGLPPDAAGDAGARIEAEVRSHGAVPATVGVLGGRPVIGLSTDELLGLVERRADVRKLSVRDLGFAMASRVDGATTVAGTIALAAAAGICVMATGGIGGVHLGAVESYDESADLLAISRTPVLVVASGAKSILDLPATLERLDTLGVPVAAFGTSRFPGFYVRDSGLDAPWTLADEAQVASAFLAHLELGRGGMLVANPIPERSEMDPDRHARVLADGLHAAHERRIAGPDVTPFLLEHFAKETGGDSVAANVALVCANAALAARIAAALATRER